MSYHADMTPGAPPPTYPQQTGYPMNQPTYNNAGAQKTAAYVPQNQPPAQYAPLPQQHTPLPQQHAPLPQQHAPLPQQQGPSYVHPAAPGGQYAAGIQHPQQKYTVAPQPMTVTQVYNNTQPQVIVVSGCPQGQHYFTTHYGACGIIAAILLFPIGLIFLCVDQETRCDRCGVRG